MTHSQAMRSCLLMPLVITSLTAGGAMLSVYVDNNWPYIVVVVGSAMIGFFGLLSLAQKEDEPWQLSEETMRTATAGAIVVAYLVLVGIVAFFVVGPNRLPGIAETMVSSFTTIVGVVLASYFGASAYVQVNRERSNRADRRADASAA